uniref:Rad50 n=1 Tax=Brachionus manjavacas TaxID=667381 RepID=M4SL97_9BILA|nr:Rad50 [Brachionus manjavacas]
MSSIEKMTIQGIRSYGPKEKDTQMIEFFTPVTLICGQNGCGKTTVIESLKYATTSDMPPNTKGSSFLFDPKLIDEIETKGKIKLFFKDTSGLTVQVQKNLCCTQKAKKLEFRTLETIISRYDSQGKLASTITSKCINADAEVVNAFGVSKAVMEHVIFCHQEDSNWPLSDGKLLKTRFDEIFAATKYIKALDALKKFAWKKSINKTDGDRAKTFGSLQEAFNKQKDLGEKLKPIKNNWISIFRNQRGFLKLKSNLTKLKTKKNLFERQNQRIFGRNQRLSVHWNRCRIGRVCRAFQGKPLIKCDAKKKEKYMKIESTKHQIKQISGSKSKISLEMGALENRFKDYVQKQKKLDAIATKACDLIGIECPSIEVITAKLSDFITDYEYQIGIDQENAKKQDTRLQSEIDAERDKKSRIEQSIQNKKESIAKYQNQYCQIEEELNLIEDDKVQAELCVKINHCEAEIEKQSSQLINVDEIKSKIKQLDNSKLNLKQREQDIDAKINKWHQNSKLQTELSMLRNEKKAKQEQIRKIKMHIEEDMENFFDQSENLMTAKSDDSMLKAIFDVECKDLDSQLGSLESSRKDLDKNLSSNEFKRKMFNDDFRSKEKQLRNYEDILLNLNDLITNDTDIDRNSIPFWKKLQDEQKNLLDEKGFLSGVDKTYKRFVQQLQLNSDDKHSCPVCMRMFKDIDEVNDTVNELNKYTRKIPQKVQDLDQKLKSNEQNLEKMFNAKSVKESYDKIKNNELTQLKQKIEEHDKNILPKLRKELIETDDKCTSEVRDVEKKIESLARNGNLEAADDTDLETLSEQKMVIQGELEQISRSIQSDQEEISSYYARSDQIHKIREKLNDYKTRRNEIESKNQKKSQLVDKKEELRTEIVNLKKEILALEASFKTCSKLVENLVNEKEIVCQKTHKELTDKNFYQEINAMFNQINDLVKLVKNFEQNDESKIAEYKKEFKLLDSNEKDLNGRVDKLYQDAENIKLEIARQEIKQRELNDNLMLRQKRKLFDAKEKQHAKKEELQLNDNTNLKDFKMEQEKLEKKRDDLHKEINEVASNINILEGRLQAINEELSLDTIKNAVEKYMVCTSDLKVLEYSVMDIEKYYKALDRAIMNYHQIKMNEINKIIKQLWRQVYRGVDIDYIEIRSEEENGAEEQIKSKKTYNYRVVLIKGDTCLDMRGRCSAGQKVLASIIIRLALAETFCLNSGILALDEPTTNLDRDNIESLASALVEIIKTRSLQKNFQLIIITHDEDFLDMLGRSEYMDQFYRVHKDEK